MAPWGGGERESVQKKMKYHQCVCVCAVSVLSFQRFKGHIPGLVMTVASLTPPPNPSLCRRPFPGHSGSRAQLRTSRVSQPPTMLRPSPVRPLEMSMVVSQPGMMGQVAGSQVRADGVDERLWAEDARESHSAPLFTWMMISGQNKTYKEPPPPPGESG